jgi:hypothetical protein
MSHTEETEIKIENESSNTDTNTSTADDNPLSARIQKIKQRQQQLKASRHVVQFPQSTLEHVQAVAYQTAQGDERLEIETDLDPQQSLTPEEEQILSKLCGRRKSHAIVDPKATLLVLISTVQQLTQKVQSLEQRLLALESRQS